MPESSTGKLTGKQSRVLDRCLRELFSAKASGSVSDLLATEPADAIARLVTVPGKSGLRILSKQGKAAHDRIVDTIQEVGVFGDDVLYSDVSRGLREITQSCSSELLRPTDACELLTLLQRQIQPRIRDHTFLIAFQGVKLIGISDVKLGSMRVVDSVDSYLDRNNLPQPEQKIEWVWKALRGNTGLVGTFKGTLDAAKHKFSRQAHLTAGVLSVAAGFFYDRGATTFRISAAIGLPVAEDGPAFLHWEGESGPSGWGPGFKGHQQFEIDELRGRELTTPGIWNYAFHIVEKTRKSDVEEAINRAIYWHGDAQRDPIAVMQFVKYWSCIECFFSIDKLDVTEALAVGVSTVLTFGHFPLYESSDYLVTRKRVKSLYGERSQAIHSAHHEHILGQDLVLLSQWAAHLIANMISFANADLLSRSVLLERLRRIDSVECSRP
jgi:hypothetical protein